MTDILRLVLTRLDHQEQPALAFEDVRRWPEGVLNRLIETGLVRKGGLAESAVYYDCPGHCLIRLDLADHPQTEHLVSLHRCQHVECGGLVGVPSEYFQLWYPHFEGLARHLAPQLELAGPLESVVPDRVYLLGTMLTAGGPMDVFLARALRQHASWELIEHAQRLRASSTPVVLAAMELPTEKLWPDLRPTFLSLAGLAAWNDEASCVEASQVLRAIRSIRPAPPKETWLTVTESARLLMKDLGLGLREARSRVSWACGARKFMTNGKSRTDRRIEKTSFDAWRLAQRDRDLAREDAPDPPESHLGTGRSPQY